MKDNSEKCRPTLPKRITLEILQEQMEMEMPFLKKFRRIETKK